MRGEERRGGGGGGLFEWNISSTFKLPASPKLFGMACPLLFPLCLKMKNILTGVLLGELDVRRSPGLSPVPTDVNFTSPAPFTAPPPSTLVWIYDLYRNRVPVSPYIGKNNRHDFSFAELYPVLCQQFFALFSCFNEFLFSWKIFTFAFQPALASFISAKP
jgi:hypothetical protein